MEEQTMGLIDILNGMQNGPRGQPNPSSGGGGMSPITMAILGLLAYKAVKSFSGSQAPANQAPANQVNPNATPSSGGGLGGLLSGGLGGLLAGGAAGSILSGGLNDLLQQFQQSGQGDAANSWVGTGANKSISPNDLAQALGADKVNALMAQTGMSRDDLLQGLSDNLPGVIDQLTPEGRLPSAEEASRWV
jgi:uncharacterized protein YidB (DUF937 family)